MLTLNDIATEDHRFIVKDPVNFSPERNKAVIAQTIREAETRMSKVQNAIEDALGERIEAVSAYGCYRFNRGDKTVKEYLGTKKWQEYVGEKLLDKVRVMKQANKIAGNDKFETSILL